MLDLRRYKDSTEVDFGVFQGLQQILSLEIDPICNVELYCTEDDTCR